MQYRSVTSVPLEAREVNGRKIIAGYAMVWDVLSQDLGGFREVVRRECIDKTLKEIHDGNRHITARMQHMGGLTTVGSTENQTLTLKPDNRGLYYEAVTPDNVFGHAAWVAVKDRYITGSSFAFRLNSGGDRWDYSTKPPTRELLSIQLDDVAPVDGAAYLQTTAEARSHVLANIEERAVDNGPRIEINVLDEIMPTWMSRYLPDGVSSGKVMEALAAVPDAQSIEVYINSPGGDVFEAHAIYNALKDHPAPVNIHVRGLAASAAGIIAMAGDTITMGEGSFLMVHNAWTVAQGNAGQLRDQAMFLDKIDAEIGGILARRSGNDSDTVRQWMKDETWFNSDEAVAAGFATGKSGESSPIDGERCRELQYRNVPRELGGPGAIEMRATVTADDVLSHSARELKRAI